MRTKSTEFESVNAPPDLLLSISDLREYLQESCGSNISSIQNLKLGCLKSAKNLLQYLALRRIDIRPLQERLMLQGLSSLGRAEPHVLASVDAIISSLQCIPKDLNFEKSVETESVTIQEGRALLERNTVELLGPIPAARATRIMVTLPTNAAERPEFLCDLLAGGTDCIRINCAHDNTEVWAQMIENLRNAERKKGRSCKILMDLGGPKLRTGPVASVQVLKARVQRDAFGRVSAPAQILFVDNSVETGFEKEIRLPVPTDWLMEVHLHDVILLQDTRGRERRLKVVEIGTGWRRTECFNNFYVTTGSIVTLSRPEARGGPLNTKIGILPDVEQPLVLKKGDFLRVTRSLDFGESVKRAPDGSTVSDAHIGCTLPDVFSQTKVGERILFDDGKIGAVIRETSDSDLRVEITQAGPSGSKLRGDKGINLPDSELRLSALTEKDLRDLEFAARNADMIGFSFVQDPLDVLELQRRLTSISDRQIGIVLKIETKRAFQRLPELLLAAMRGPLTGVMIARGDLAIECGFERMAEVQEEILWICEAAHVPAIWATQVLESLAKTGVPSRAEITDAAMGVRAECVMLNKGPFILDAVHILNDVLTRMQEHQSKKRTLLRKLNAWTTNLT